MSNHTVHLVSYRNSPAQRAHFAIFVPSEANPEVGTLIHVVGAPMAGYRLEFKRNYSLATTLQVHTIVSIGRIEAQHIVHSTSLQQSSDDIPKGDIERAASQVPPPRVSQNFMAPVNDTTNKRCQEWTAEYVHRLVDLRYLQTEAIQIVQSKRDPPNHGIGLQPAGRGRGRGQ